MSSSSQYAHVQTKIFNLIKLLQKKNDYIVYEYKNISYHHMRL